MASKKKKVEAKPAPKGKGKAKVPTSSRAMRADALMAYVDKKLDGRAELCNASDYTLPWVTKRLPTGVLSLDIALGGGWPAGAISQIIGPKNAGKDYLIWQTIRQLLGIGGTQLHVLLAQTEMRADRTQAQKVGCAVAMSELDIANLDRARVANGHPPYTEEEKVKLRFQIGKIHEVHGEALEDLYDVILRGVAGRVYHLIVINSFGSVMSNAEAESETLRDKTYAGTAGVNTQFLHKLNALLTMRDENEESRDTCILGVNQIRDDIKNPNKSYKAGGGNALEHAKFVDLFVTSGQAHGKEMMVPSSMGMKQMKDIWGKDVRWEIKKGKAGIHEGQAGSYVYKFREPREDPTEPIVEVNNADFVLDYIATGRTYGVVQASGAWFSVVNEKGEAILTGNGMGALAKQLKEDAIAKQQAGDPNTFLDYIRRVCLVRAGVNVNYATMYENED
jgi:RecA/RadA recombinase